MAAVAARRQQAYLAEQQALFAAGLVPFGRMDLWGGGMAPPFDLLAAQRRVFAAQTQGIMGAAAAAAAAAAATQGLGQGGPQGGGSSNNNNNNNNNNNKRQGI